MERMEAFVMKRWALGFSLIVVFCQGEIEKRQRKPTQRSYLVIFCVSPNPDVLPSAVLQGET